MTDNQHVDQDQQITSIADAVVKLKELRESNKNLNEPDIEEKFARLSLAFKTDKFTLGKRLDLQLRQRDIAEKNIEGELRALRESMNALNQLCTESDMRELITKTQQHVDIVQQATMRMSSRAETYGAIQQEQRMNCAFETMLNYVEHLKLLYDKEHLELEEYRRLLAEHNLLPNEKALLDEDAKRILPPRSQSLSYSSRPEFIRRGSLGTFIRPPGDSDKTINRENSTGQLNLAVWALSSVRQKLESKTRLLSSVCLLNNNFDSSSSGKPAPSGSLSPKSRRSSLPVGPLAQASSNTPQVATIRAHNSINENNGTRSERKESFVKASREKNLSRTESEESTVSKGESENPVQESEEATEISLKDSSDVSFLKPPLTSSHMDQVNTSELPCSLQESACDTEISSSVCLLPEIIIPVKSKSMFLLNMIQKAASSRIWRLDSATLLLHTRYTLSAILVTAAMLTLVLTFVPN